MHSILKHARDGVACASIRGSGAVATCPGLYYTQASLPKMTSTNCVIWSSPYSLWLVRQCTATQLFHITLELLSDLVKARCQAAIGCVPDQ